MPPPPPGSYAYEKWKVFQQEVKEWGRRGEDIYTLGEDSQKRLSLACSDYTRLIISACTPLPYGEVLNYSRMFVKFCL